jgi:SAM-dependent methyltransferase
MSLCDRILDHEWLDLGHLRPEEVRANLRELELINRWLGGARSVVPHVVRAMNAAPASGPSTGSGWPSPAMQGPPRAKPRGGPFRVLDIACGGGDMLRQVVTRGRRMGRAVLGIGVDANEQVLEYARGRSADYPELQWAQADALALPFASGSFDLVMCSCFLHHLEPQEASRLLTQAAALSRGVVVVGDLVHSWIGAAAFRLFCQLARLHPVTRHDGLVSLQRSYHPHELAAVARAAGLANWRLHRHPFCRATLVCEVR